MMKLQKLQRYTFFMEKMVREKPMAVKKECQRYLKCTAELKEEIDKYACETDKKLTKWYEFAMNAFFCEDETVLNRIKRETFICIAFFNLSKFTRRLSNIRKCQVSIRYSLRRMEQFNNFCGKK